jgi:peptidoglycan/xylan/chitin deacetylase (PgdA/CDA1 family)
MKFATQFQDVLNRKPLTFREKLRAIALDFLYAFEKFKKNERFLNKPRVQLLYFHHIFEDEEQNFRNLLKKLAKNHTFISHSEAVDRIVSNKIDKPYISFSSDDGFKNNIKAAEILNEFGVSCCFYINPDVIEETDFEIIKKHCDEKLDFPATEMLTWNEVNQLQKMGHEIGSHTLNHKKVTDMSSDEMLTDFSKSKLILSEKCGEIKHFAYPYGRFFHFNKEAQKVVFTAGYQTCSSAERGCHINTDEVQNETDILFRRDQIIAHWSWQHIFYFLINNAKKATINANKNPYL